MSFRTMKWCTRLSIDSENARQPKGVGLCRIAEAGKEYLDRRRRLLHFVGRKGRIMLAAGRFFAALLVVLCLLGLTEGFLSPLVGAPIPDIPRLNACNPRSDGWGISPCVSLVSKHALGSCRRNNKEEKRLRNLQYARKFMKRGVKRKQLVVEARRAKVAQSQQDCYRSLFQFTTEADAPEYHGFDDVINDIRQ